MMINVGHTDYEIDRDLSRVFKRIKVEELNYQDIQNKYSEYKDKQLEMDEMYYPFYFWALSYFDMYLWKPNLIESEKEREDLVKEYREYKNSLNLNERSKLKGLYIAYRDRMHRNGLLLYPAYYWCLKFKKGTIN